MNKVLVVMPAYNEERNIGKVIQGIQALQQPFDLLVVNDGSEDKTAAIAIKAGAIVVNLPYNSGYGIACQTGFKYAVERDYQFLLQLDSDGQHIPEDLMKLLPLLESGEADVVIGSRFISGESYHVGFLKRFAIAMFRVVIKIATKVSITDPSSGLQGLNRKAFEHYAQMDNYPMDYPDADVILGMILMGFKFKEIPATFKARESGKSMHSGLMPAYYMLKVFMSVALVILRGVFKRGESK